MGFLLHWESLLSTHGDELGMLEDFIVAVRDINQLTFKVPSHTVSLRGPGFILSLSLMHWQLSLAETMQDHPLVTGSRYSMCVEVPVQKTVFRLLPAALQGGKEISVCAVLFTQGINEQQSIADTSVQYYT